MARRALLALGFVGSMACSSESSADEYDAPVNFYGNATGTGVTLQSQLYNIMRGGHILRTYGDFRNSARLHDADPDRPGNILLAYDRSSVSGVWQSGRTWNREHVWPQARQPGSANNSIMGNLGDPHSLRPADPRINSDRGNLPFRASSSTGGFGFVSGGYFFPGDFDKGDIARSLFYSDTRYGPEIGINLVSGQPRSNQMGDLDALLAWHYLDVPDTFERRRNHVIYSRAENPSYYTNNRNAYVDRPEYVWSVFKDQNNDSRLSLDGATVQANGASQRILDFGRVLAGGALPAAQQVTLNKTGSAGTYYSVTSNSDAITTDITGRYNAFAIGGPGQQSIQVAVQGDTSTPSLIFGTVQIDNLDVTTGAGQGRGAQDANDRIDAFLAVLDHSNASFSGASNQDALTLDLGDFLVGGTAQPTGEFQVFNYASAFGEQLTARLDFDQFLENDQSDKFELVAAPFSDLNAGQSRSLTVNATADEVGTFGAAYLLIFTDEDLAGEQQQQLIVNVSFDVVGVLGDMNNDGALTDADIDPFVLALTDPEAFEDQFAGVDADLLGDFTGDGVLSNADVAGFVSLFSTIPGVNTDAVPEPASLIVLAGGLMLCLRRKTTASAL